MELKQREILNHLISLDICKNQDNIAAVTSSESSQNILHTSMEDL